MKHYLYYVLNLCNCILILVAIRSQSLSLSNLITLTCFIQMVLWIKGWDQIWSSNHKVSSKIKAFFWYTRILYMVICIPFWMSYSNIIYFLCVCTVYIIVESILYLKKWDMVDCTN